LNTGFISKETRWRFGSIQAGITAKSLKLNGKTLGKRKLLGQFTTPTTTSPTRESEAVSTQLFYKDRQTIMVTRRISASLSDHTWTFYQEKQEAAVRDISLGERW